VKKKKIDIDIHIDKEERREEALITQLLGAAAAAVSSYVVVADFLGDCFLSLISVGLFVGDDELWRPAANSKVRGTIRKYRSHLTATAAAAGDRRRFCTSCTSAWA